MRVVQQLRKYEANGGEDEQLEYTPRRDCVYGRDRLY